MKRILFFESDLDLVERLTQGLEALDIALDVATEQREGLELAHENKPDLVLLSVELPSTNGWLICNRFKRDKELCSIPLVMTSAEASNQVFEAHKKLDAHADAYLRKPYELDDLVPIITALLAGEPLPPELSEPVVLAEEIDEALGRLVDPAELSDKGRGLPGLLQHESPSDMSAALPAPEWFDDRLESPAGRLIMLYGASKGAVIPVVSEGVSIGRDPESSIMLDHGSVSRNHCVVTAVSVGDAPPQAVVEDRASTNGTYVNMERVDSRELQDGDLIHVGITLFKYFSAANFKAYLPRHAYQKLSLDSVTELEVYAHFREKLQREARRCRRFGRRLSLVMLRIDGFPRMRQVIAEELGATGLIFADKVFVELASLLRTLLEEEDTEHELGRWNEHFAVLLPEIGQTRARRIAELVRRAVEAHHFELEGTQHAITVSCAVATRSGKSLIADEAISEGSMPVIGTATLESTCLATLDHAIDTGGNRVLCIDEPSLEENIKGNPDDLVVGVQTIPLRWLKVMIARTLAERGGRIEVGASSVVAPQTSVVHGLDDRLLGCEQTLLEALSGQGVHFVAEAHEGAYVYFRPTSVEGTMAAVQAVVSTHYRTVTDADPNVSSASRGLAHGLSGPHEPGTPVDVMIAETLTRLLKDE